MVAFFSTQPEYKDENEERILAEMDDNFFLEHKACKLVLSSLVHRHNTEINNEPESSSVTREDQRKMNAADVRDERRAASDRHKDNVAKQTAVQTKQQRKLQMKAVRQGIESNRVSCESKRAKTIMGKIETLMKLKDVTIAMEGEDSYNSQLLALKNELLGAQATGEEVDDSEDSEDDSNSEEEENVEQRNI